VDLLVEGAVVNRDQVALEPLPGEVGMDRLVSAMSREMPAIFREVSAASCRHRAIPLAM